MSGSAGPTEATRVARDYYNSDDADNFYAIIWGGEDIHVGLYETGEDPIFDASRRTVERMASLLPTLGNDTRVLDLGSGYCGAARRLAGTYGCKVVGLNLSEKENERARQLNEAQGLGDCVEVVDGSFEAIAAPDETFDVVWSQDAILHSGDRQRVLSEVARVLKPGGQFVFTDPMQSDDCPAGVLQPILDRIHLQSLGSPGFYRERLAALGLREERFLELTPQLVMHYSRVLQETEKRQDEFGGKVSAAYLDRMKKGLGHWIDGGEKGHLAWGIFRFSKPA